MVVMVTLKVIALYYQETRTDKASCRAAESLIKT
jgi:hypothetical protein